MKRQQTGIALLEALLATVILAIGLLGTIGLQARAHSALAQADMRAEATIACEKLLGVMANDQGPNQANLAAYALAAGAVPRASLAGWYAETRALIPNAVISVVITPDGTRQSRIDIAISWIRKSGERQNQHRVTSYIAAS